MPTPCFETRVVKEEIWTWREKNSRERLEKKQRRMRNMLSGVKGEFREVSWSLFELKQRLTVFNMVYVCRLAQGEMHQQKLEYALQESQKPLARHYDDEDLDRLLREQEREGDPMAAMLRRKKHRTTKTDGEEHAYIQNVHTWSSGCLMQPV